MNIHNDILNLYDFSLNTQDNDFKEFTNNLLCFCEEQKEKVNINDIETFKILIQQQLKAESYKDILLHLLSILEQKGFIDYEDFYKTFKKSFKTQENKEQDKDLKSLLESELLVNANLSQAKTLQEFHKNLNQEPQNFAKISQSQSLNNENLKVSPDEMLSYIKDKNSIIFPFSKESTLENKDFMKAFRAVLNTKSNDELEMLLNHMKAKNKALRAELKNLNTKNHLLEELQDNENLSKKQKALSNIPQQTQTNNEIPHLLNENSLAEDIKKLDKANEDLKQNKALNSTPKNVSFTGSKEEQNNKQALRKMK